MIAAFLGATPPNLVLGVGIVLILNGLHLGYVSRHDDPGRIQVLYFSAGDAAWVLISLTLVVTGTFVTTAPGIVLTLLVAVGVGVLGLLQFLKVRH
ncbi:hypothetical protein [Notoacmeibacter ruber]|uniref:Uncharacterized protein n=1 Tax=Notoacmeibacter ruber TaxID=2670375 RepID=A0A3L7JEJ6_9HYPH|nr:hypothetical protein [Notoacmeibacter ruber]RLQ89197.1 hypothetical protein D8780_14050 [Notoacmeibacter ruber]